MRTLEHRVAALRGRWRRALATRGGRTPSRLAPEHLVLRLDQGDLPKSMGDGPPLDTAAWHRILVSAVEWLGPLPVTILAQRSSAEPLTAELLRFAHRLECPTTLRTNGSGIDQREAEELVDRGLDRLQIVVGGVSAAVHGAVVDGAHDDAVRAAVAAVAARLDRQAALDIELSVPWLSPADTELRAVIGWARQAGVDGLRLEPPWRGWGLPSDPEQLDAVIDLSDSFHRTREPTIRALHAMSAHGDGLPGIARKRASAAVRGRHCPVGGLRLELTARGRLCCCPFKAPIASDLGVSSADLKDLWLRGSGHLGQIRNCDRACRRLELPGA